MWFVITNFDYILNIYYNESPNKLNQEADIAIGSITITGPRSTAADFSISYYETAAGYIANIPRELSKWGALFRPYKLNVWIPLMVALILSGPIFWMILQQHATPCYNSVTIQKCYETTYKILLMQGILSLP